MKLKAFKTIQDVEYLLSKLQGHIVEFTNQLTMNPFLSGTIVESTIGVTDTTLSHGLKAEPTGWIILDKDANSNIWKVSQNSKEIVLKASASVTCKVWVF